MKANRWKFLASLLCLSLGGCIDPKTAYTCGRVDGVLEVLEKDGRMDIYAKVNKLASPLDCSSIRRLIKK